MRITGAVTSAECLVTIVILSLLLSSPSLLPMLPIGVFIWIWTTSTTYDSFFCGCYFRILFVDLFPFAETESILFFEGLPKGPKALFSQVLRSFLTEIGSFNMKFGFFSSAGIISIVKVVIALINEKCVGVIIVLRSYNLFLTQTIGLAFMTTSILVRIILVKLKACQIKLWDGFSHCSFAIPASLL